ncbi:hypothetical protein CSC71_07195 [Pseudoxanthomonas sangjuensis]|uniref:hypothetical protein n=1 Tax=Pseudoxanthomonas sangjuensis TaxID=1503750 RepID=UPI0013908EC1|nr:hypothetical protein [Pseudoxanthomonas sangjuensis]KAF1713463.1 hypothetical protein CSC71_07195 [Pseudoxanthomonas sangjuensis]
MQFRTPDKDSLITIGLLAILLVVFLFEHGAFHGMAIFAGLLHFLAVLVLAFRALSSLIHRQWIFGKAHLLVTGYSISYLAFATLHQWSFAWTITAMAVAVALAITFSLALCKWLGFLRQ